MPKENKVYFLALVILILALFGMYATNFQYFNPFTPPDCFGCTPPPLYVSESYFNSINMKVSQLQVDLFNIEFFIIYNLPFILIIIFDILGIAIYHRKQRKKQKRT